MSIVEKNEFQNRVFLFSNFLGAAILNNCDVKWLPFCCKAKALCLITKGQPRRVTIFQDGGAQEIWKQKYATLKIVFLHYRQSSEKKFKLALLQILYPAIKSDSLIGVEVPFKEFYCDYFFKLFLFSYIYFAIYAPVI